MIIRLRYFALQGIVSIVGITGFDRKINGIMEVLYIHYTGIAIISDAEKIYLIIKMRKTYEKINQKNPQNHRKRAGSHIACTGWIYYLSVRQLP